jgi:hypothetical protein
MTRVEALPMHDTRCDVRLGLRSALQTAPAALLPNAHIGRRERVITRTFSIVVIAIVIALGQWSFAMQPFAAARLDFDIPAPAVLAHVTQARSRV